MSETNRNIRHKPIEYHNNLIEALKALKLSGPDGAKAWLEQADSSVVEEARAKACIEDRDGVPALTARGSVVSRMRVSYQRGADVEFLVVIMLSSMLNAHCRNAAAVF